MKKKIKLSITIIVLLMLLLTGCQKDFQVQIQRGLIKNNTSIYYNENYVVDGYEWDGMDLIIHFKEE